MPNTYTQIYIQYVFVVKYREALINDTFETELFKYINGIASKLGHKLYIINGTANHIHLLVSLSPNVNISELAKEIKRSSTNFINENKYISNKFQWQEGFGAFSYSHSQIPKVIQYIKNQKEHHKKETFKDEYIKLLNNLEVQYNEKYLFDWIE